MENKVISFPVAWGSETMPFKPKPSRGSVRRAAQLSHEKVDWSAVDAATRKAPRLHWPSRAQAEHLAKIQGETA